MYCTFSLYVLHFTCEYCDYKATHEKVVKDHWPVTRKLVPPTVGPGGPVMAIQDGPGPTMAATNGPPGPVMAAIIGPPLPSLVPWSGDLPWQP